MPCFRGYTAASHQPHVKLLEPFQTCSSLGFLDDVAPSPRTHFLALNFIVQEVPQGVAQGVHITGRNKHTVLTGADDLGNTAAAAAHRWKAAGHSFKVNKPRTPFI